jgi:pimeloyl-ACP methyl ester carboxylesterase
MNTSNGYTEHYIDRDQGRVYARDYPGQAPALVLMHGFPDNMHIYDEIIPFLRASGRRVVTFDFLGFGGSDKPANGVYTFENQLAELEAVVDSLKLEKFVPVVHDSSGPAGINYTLNHPERVDYLCILNSGYDDRAGILWPEMVALFAYKSLAALSLAMAQDPAQFGWLLGWQKKKFSDALPEPQRPAFETGTGKVIADNFIKQPSSGPAFVQLASHFFDELAKNTQHLPELKKLDVPTRVIWGEFDPYMNVAAGHDRALHFKDATTTILPGGHWVQSDLPELVARAML